MSDGRKIPWISLTAQHKALHHQILELVGKILDSGIFAAGPYTAEFEKAFAAHEGATHAFAVSNGTLALEAALAASGVGAGDDVLTPPNSFFATTEAVLLRGARPVYVDIDPETYTLDTAKLEAALTPRTKAVLPVHLYGLPAAMPAIREFADQHGLKVIADACQAHGGKINGLPHTAWADVTAYSFYPTKK